MSQEKPALLAGAKFTITAETPDGLLVTVSVQPRSKTEQALRALVLAIFEGKGPPGFEVRRTEEAGR